MTLEKSASWMMLLIVIILSVVGVFFALTDPTSWPEKSTKLSSTDMKLMPQLPTIWCEAVAMWASHDFVVYKLPAKPNVSPNPLFKFEVFANSKSLRGLDHLELKYHMLIGSVMEIRATASRSQNILRIYRGNPSKVCFETGVEEQQDSNESDEFDSREHKSEWVSGGEDIPDSQCPPPLSYLKISRGSKKREEIQKNWGSIAPLHFNVTSTDDYTIVVSNEARHETSEVSLYVVLDRTRYDIKKSRDNLHVCGPSAVCLVPLSFASSDRTIVSVPAEADAGLYSYTVSTRCRPRISVFALMTVLFPIMLFALINLLVKFDRKRLQRQHQRAPECQQNVPFLERGPFVDGGPVVLQKRVEELPPSYEMVCQSDPPPYATVEHTKN